MGGPTGHAYLVLFVIVSFSYVVKFKMDDLWARFNFLLELDVFMYKSLVTLVRLSTFLEILSWDSVLLPIPIGCCDLVYKVARDH